MKTAITDPIAIQEFIWVHKDGYEVPVIARIGKPYKIDEYSWACPAELLGVDSQYPDLQGEGSMQALCLAIQLIKTRLGHMLEDNETLCDINNKEDKWSEKQLQIMFGR